MSDDDLSSRSVKRQATTVLRDEIIFRTPQAVKNVRQLPPRPKDAKPSEKQHVTDEVQKPIANTPVTGWRFPHSISRRFGHVGRRTWRGWSPRELNSFQPVRSTLSWKHPQHRNGDYTDQWFEQQFKDLWGRVELFCETMFGAPGDNVLFGWTWSSDMAPEFCRLVEMVAIGGTSTDEWRDMIDSGASRKFLVQAVLTKIMALRVFSELLFGADESQRNSLKVHDEIMLEHDGYERATLRSAAVRAMLNGNGGVPPRFWNGVDKVAIQTTTILLPLINNIVGPSNPDAMPSLQDFHQQVHGLIAFSAWLSVCIRWSPTVMRFDWAAPGDPYGGGDFINAAPEAYENSAAVADIVDELLTSSMQDEKLRNAMAKKATSNIKTAALARVAGGQAERQARVQISVTPRVRLFEPIYADKLSPKTGRHYIYEISRASVVYYQGFLDENIDRQLRGPTLTAIVRRARNRVYMKVAGFAILLLLVVVLVVALPRIMAMEWPNNGLVGVVEAAREMIPSVPIRYDGGRIYFGSGMGRERVAETTQAVGTE